MSLSVSAYVFRSSMRLADGCICGAEGGEIWVAAENAYNERVARVENQIIARLRDRLGTARNANEMFRVFSKFNALFVRPKVGVQMYTLKGFVLTRCSVIDSWCHPGIPDTTH